MPPGSCTFLSREVSNIFPLKHYPEADRVLLPRIDELGAVQTICDYGLPLLRVFLETSCLDEMVRAHHNQNPFSRSKKECLGYTPSRQKIRLKIVTRLT